MSPCDRSKGGDLLTNCRKRRLRRLVEAVLQRKRFLRNPHHLSQEPSSAKTLLHFAFRNFSPSALHILFPGAVPTARSVSPIVSGRRAFVIKLPYVNDQPEMIKHKSEWGEVRSEK